MRHCGLCPAKGRAAGWAIDRTCVSCPSDSEGERRWNGMLSLAGKRSARCMVLIVAVMLMSVAAGCASEQNQAGSRIKVMPAKVVKGIDGDTVKAEVNGKTESVRLIGVNTPELAHPDLHIKEQPYGREAEAYTTKALLGHTVYLELDAAERDKYGRLLAYIWLARPRDGSETEVREKMFNARLLLNGYAQVMTVPPNVKYQDLFVRFEREARDNKAGLWGT